MNELNSFIGDNSDEGDAFLNVPTFLCVVCLLLALPTVAALLYSLSNY